MAEYISMKQVPSGTVTAVDDRILYDINLQSGIIYGCEVSYQGNNMIHINAGYGVVKGGLFEMEDHTEYVELSDDEPTTGQIYLKFDAAAVDKLVIVKETTNDLHPLEQDVNANYDNGVYEIPICSFTATTTALENVTQTWPDASGERLSTTEELMANTLPGKLVDALVVKQINTNLVNYLPYADSVDTIVSTTTASGDWVTYTATHDGFLMINAKHPNTASAVNFLGKAIYADQNAWLNITIPIKRGQTVMVRAINTYIYNFYKS